MDTSVARSVMSKNAVIDVYGEYASVVTDTPEAVSGTLISRSLMHPLPIRQLVDLVEREFVSVLSFPLVRYTGRGINIEAETGFAFNTPSYMMICYRTFQDINTSLVNVNYHEYKGMQAVPVCTKREYLLISQARNGAPRVSLIDLELRIIDGTRIERSVRQRNPSAEEYYTALSDEHILSTVIEGMKELFESSENESKKRLDILRSRKESLLYFEGQMKERYLRR